jgi:uncharacterized repeat protein (TIGR01451 family)
MRHSPPLLFCLLLLAAPLAVWADDLSVTNETPAFILDTRLPATDPGPGSLIVQAETPPFTLDTRLPAGDPGPGSLIVQFESPPFVLDTRLPATDPGPGALIVQAESPPFALDTRLPDGIVPSSGTVVTESGPFTLDTRLPDGIVPSAGTTLAESAPFTLDTRLPDGISFTNAVATVESPPFTLDTRLPADTTPLPNLVTEAESPAFTLDTRIPPQDSLYTNLIAMAQSGRFTLDTTSGWFDAPAQALDGGSAGGKARFSLDGLRLAKADGSRVLLWNLHSTRSNAVFSGHSGEVVSLEFSPLGDQLLTGSTDGTLRWWDTANRSELGRIDPAGSGTVYAAYASDGARVLAGRGTNVSLLGVPDMQMLRDLTGLDGSATAVALAPEGLALAGTSTRHAVLWDTATGALRQRLTNHTGLVTAAAIYPGGGRAMTVCLDGIVRIWSTTNGTELLRITQGTPVADAVLSADGEVIATCDAGTPGTAYLWNAQTGDLMRVFTDAGIEPSQIQGVAISPDHTLLATTHVDGRVRLWNTGLVPRPAQTVTSLGMGTNAPVTLRSHGLYYFELAAEAGRSLVVTLEAAPVATANKSRLGGSADIPVGVSGGLSSDATFANLGELADKNVGAPGGPQILSFRPAPTYADITAFRMTAMKGALPSEYDYETFAQASVTNLHCEMPVVTSTSNKVYVLVFAPYLSAGSIQARIRADYADFHLSSVVPASGGNRGSVTARIQGTGITPDTTARLVGPGGAVANSQLALWGDSSKAWFTFALSNAPAGSYQVEISKPGASPIVLANAFQVVAAVGSQLQASLTAPSAVRPGRDYGMTLKYANVGDVDVAAPLFIVAAGDQQPSIYRPSLPNFAAGILTVTRPNTGPKIPYVQILGLNQDGPPGVLPPGASWEIPLYFQGDGGVGNMTFNLSVLKADATPIDWTTLESRFRPSDMDTNLWAAVWANFKLTVGNTWADYLRALDTQAHLLALANQPSYDAGDLLSALFSQAVGAPYRRTLAAAVDAQAPAPALPLQFSRFATDGLEHRFNVGPLGRGWSHNYEYALTQPSTGVVVIRTPGGGARRFALGSDGVWRGGTGDYATLTATAGGGFALLEKEGMAWQFDASGLLLSIEEPNHNRITLSYSDGQLTGLAHSAGPSFLLEHNGQGRIARLTDQAGQVTDYEYDPAGEHLLRVVSPGAVTNRYTYQAATGSASDHALTSVGFPDGTHQFFGWDAQGRLAEQSRDGGAERLQFTYETDGTVTMRDAQNAVTTLRLGTRGQLLQMTDALGRPVTFNYDANFNLTRLTGPAGETTELGYDSQGNASQIVNPLGQPVALGHAALGRLSNLRDARAQSTDFGYDPQGNLTGITYADTSAETFGYNPTGSVTNWTNRRGQTIQFARNAQGQLSRKTYPDGRTIDYGYDSRGLLTNIVDTAGAPTFLSAITSLEYDARGFLTRITYPDGKGFTFEYNAAGRRTRRVGHDGYTLNYGYDIAGRLETLTEGASHELVRYAYNSTGQLWRETKGNGTFTTYNYDLAGQLIALTNHASLVTVLSFFNYTYDAKGNRLTMTTAAGLTRYEYDGLNQLIGVTYPGGRHVTYAYDAAGNRMVVSDNGTPTFYTVNVLNQYTQSGDTTFGYDTDGNMTHRTDATGTTTYDYDYENRLMRVATPTKGTFQYTYNALGNRTTVTHDGITSRYLHDPVGLVDVAAEYEATGSLVARYDQALGLVARSDAAGNPAFYSFDALGNTRELTGTGGTVLNAYDYDAFGKLTSQDETTDSAFKQGGRFGMMEDKSGVVFQIQSEYDTELGRAVSQSRTIDPIDLGRSGGKVARGWLGLEDSVKKLLAGTVRNPFLTGVGLGKGIYGMVAGVNNAVWAAQGDLFRMGGLFEDIGRLGTAYFDNPLWAKYGKFTDLTVDLIGEWLSPKKGFQAFLAVLDYSDKLLQGFLEIWDLSQRLFVASQVTASVVRPIDPNDKIGPKGVGPNRVVSAQDELEYMIRFENFATASAPVQELIVVDYLDAGLDWTSARFKEMAYGGRIITPSAGSQSFAIRDTPPADSPALTGIGAAQMVVNASGSINPQMGRVEWRLSAMDTNTSFFPLDALTGFLPPEDGTGRGQGYVKLAVRPKSNLPIGTAITNLATIVFDGNDPIATPAVWNIIADVPSLAATIAYLPGQIMAGTPFTYTVGLTNTGTNTVTNVVLTNAVPDGMSVAAATATHGTVTITNGIVRWDLGTVTNGFGGVLTVTVLPAQEGTFANHLFFSGGSGLAIYSSPWDMVVLPAAPRLSIRVVDGEVELFWSTNYAGFHPQKAPSLAAPATWAYVTNAPAVLGTKFHLPMGLPASTEFYRLVRP